MEKKDKMGIDGLRNEDVTKYGEFVTSYFAWVGLDKQKEKVEKLEDIDKNDDSKKY